jgi:hypothetical protein
MGWLGRLFLFHSQPILQKIPPFLVGRKGWDPWLVWFPCHHRIPTIDASHDVVAVHQNHDYAYLGKGTAALQSEEEAKYNWNLGNPPRWHYFTTNAASKKLVRGTLRNNRFAWLAPMQRCFAFFFYSVWFSLLKRTKPIRHSLGLRRTNLT